MAVALFPVGSAAGEPRGDEPTVEVIESWDGLAALAPEWNALVDLDPRRLPFLRSEFIALWLRHFAPGARLHVVTVRAGGELQAVLPLIPELDGGAGGLLAPALVSPTNPHSCRFDLLLRPGPGGERVVAALWDHLAGLPGCHRVVLHDVPVTDGCANRLLELARARGLDGVWESQDSPYIPLSRAGSFQAYEAGLPAKLKANLRRRARNLAARGPVELERFPREDAAEPSQLEVRVAEILALEAAGWKGRAGTAMAQSPEVRGFYHDLCRLALERGWLRLYVLRLGGQAVACHLGLCYGGRYFLLKPAYDERHADCSPGQLLMREVIADLYQAGIEELDFLGPMMGWKRDWTQESRPHRWLYLLRPTWRAQLWRGGKFVLKPRLRRLAGRARAEGERCRRALAAAWQSARVRLRPKEGHP